MDAVSLCDERCVLSELNQTEAEGPAPSEIPRVSLCPPESEDAESPTNEDSIEGDHINHLFTPPSSSQLYDQVLQSHAYQSPRIKRCQCCDHQQPITDSISMNQTNVSSHSDYTCNAVKTVHRCSPFHQPICHNTMQCPWLQGSHDGNNYKPVQRHVVTVRTERLHRIPKNYSQVIVEYPMTVLISCAVVLLAFSVAGILIGPLPDFSDPLEGFEPRGTDIGIRLAAWTKLQESTGPGKALSMISQKFVDQSIGREVSSKTQQHLQHRSRRMLHTDTTENAYFCNDPAGDRYAQLVFRSENSESLWSLKAIYSMCEMEQTQIRSDSHFKELCQVKSGAFGTKGKGECCPSWSLGNFLSLLNNVSSCFSLTAQQVSDSLGLLRYCAPYYHDGSLVSSCAERSKYGSCASVPHPCKHSSIIYQILHYLVDKDFLGPQTVEYQVPSLKYSVLFLPMTKGNALMEIYLQHLEGRELTYNNTTITGMDLGIKQTLFKYYLSRDLVYPILTVLALLLTMALYLKSFLLSAMSLVAVTLSLLTSYFFYKVVFGLLFFPLLNLMAVLILFGSCSNQAFTFNDFWKSQLSHNPPVALEKRIHRVLQEIGYLILVSGLTSSITFYSGYISSITVVRCFAVYLGSASLINTLFALVWLPSSIVLQERHAAGASTSAAKPSWKPCCSKNPGGFWDTSSRKRCLFTMGQKFRGLKRGISDTSNLIFLKVLPCGVVKFRYIWICWFAALAAGGIYIACVDPGMKLPSSDSRATQLFRSSHPFERYDAEYRHQFMFERMKQGEDEPMTMTLIWGVTPANDGAQFNPRSNGSFTMDPEFNISSSEAQVWLRKLCGRIRNQSFYSSPPADKEAIEDNTCFVEDLIHWVSIRRCSESEDAFTYCCNNITFPYPASVFERCLKMMMEEQTKTRTPRNAGLRFDSQNRIAALVVVFKTSQLYSFNFNKTSNFYKQITSWFNNEISSAPLGLQKGWFVSQLLLFDLQQCLSSETLVVAGFSVALTFASLLLTTWNIPLSIYVTFAVGGSVFVTVGLLVLLEWQLNSVEALFISAAAGLSVDFVVNYCISYCLAPSTDRLGRVAYSLKKMGCPVATGAGAYFCVGIIMLPATALLFRKLGIFLLLVKCVACGFATFFFQSLCCFFGPEKNCGKLIIPCAKETATENVPPSCSGVEAGNNNPSANGTFSCGTGMGSQGRRNCNKEGGGSLLCPDQHRHRQQHTRLGREPEQYELQPLACHLSDSFENSTCTSKLSNRPSVLSDDIEFCGLSPKRYYDRISTESVNEEICSRHLKGCNKPQAVQTSSPYKESKTRPVVVPPRDPAKEKHLCQKCHSGPGNKLWNVSLSSSSLEDITVTETTNEANKRSLSMDGAYRCHAHKRLLSCQSQSSFEGLEDSNETCLSDIEPAVSIAPPTVTERELRPGHLNGKRDTLRLSLRETVYDPGSPGSGRRRTSQSDLPVILPNSQPGLPDVWIKRDGKGEDNS